MTSPLEAIFAVLVGFILGRVPVWLYRKRKLKAHWCAIRAEIDLCKEMANKLLADEVLSPLYRLPTVAFQTSFPLLLAEGVLTETESLALTWFSNHAQEMNRGLDFAAEAHTSGDQELLRKQNDRNRLKARGLVQSADAKDCLYDTARRIVDEKIDLKWWRY